jgi:hypothetical protein
VAYPITFYPGALDAAAATEISLARGEQSVADINLQPVPALHFRVKVDETSGSPSYPSLEVRLFDTAVPVAVQSVAGNHGSVTLAGVAPGRYTLRLSDRNSNEMRIASEQEIDVAASGDLPASQIQPRVPVIATVQAESGVPLQGQLNVRLYNKKSGETFAERLNPKGEAEFSGGVPPGNYEISIGGSAGAFLSSVTSGQVKPVGRMLAIKGPGPVKIALSLAAGQSQITGSVQKDGKPFAGAMVLLVPADPGHNQVLFRRDQSDTDGTFTLANVVPGKYTLLALENGWDLEWTKPSVLKPFLPQGEAVEAKSSGKLDLKLNVQ